MHAFDEGSVANVVAQRACFARAQRDVREWRKRSPERMHAAATPTIATNRRISWLNQ